MPEQIFIKPNSFFPKLFEPGRIGRVHVKNRIVMPPMGTQFASDTGAVTERMIQHYVRRAGGGVGLIVVEFACIDYPRGKGHIRQLSLHDDKLIAGHASLTEAVHAAGAKIFIQVHHAGGNAKHQYTEGLEPVAPSPRPSRPPQEQPRILKTDELPELVEKFALTVERAKRAGYDGVELHGAHGYLISEFMSPYINKRTDAYGGNLANRMRFPLNVIRRAKEIVGDSYPITMRLSGEEFVKGGRSVGESKQIASMLEKAGLAGLHITAGVDTDFDWCVDPIFAPQGRKVYLAAAIKEAVNIPIITVGVIREPEFAEATIAEGKADFVAVGRGLLADPDWPIKAAKGHPEEIHKCFSCNYCDGIRNTAGKSIRCVMNLELGQGDSGWDVEHARDRKRVMVVGGGPAGIEASRIAALRGHDVTLFEKEPELGGQLVIGARAPGKDKIYWLIESLVRRLSDSGAQVKLSSAVSAETIAEFAPDVVVIATGGKPMVPDIPGVNGPNVITAWSVVSGEVKIGATKVAIIGGNATGCEVALQLTKQFNEISVTLIEQFMHLAPDMEQFARAVTNRELAAASNVDVQLGWRVIEINESGVKAVNTEGQTRLFEADTNVLAVGVEPMDELLNQLQSVSAQIFIVGDCRQPQNIAAALTDGRIMGGLI
jgi:2,4-dienoyl-CoA reductase-like NADH-dependent reductase (Old Yellow Enzyme family)/thioredoxin reductase